MFELMHVCVGAMTTVIKKTSPGDAPAPASVAQLLARVATPEHAVTTVPVSVPTGAPSLTRRYEFSEQQIRDLGAGKVVTVDLTEGDPFGAVREISALKVRLARPDADTKSYRLMAFDPSGKEVGFLDFTIKTDKGETYLDMGLTEVRPEFRRNGVNSALFGLMEGVAARKANGEPIKWIETSFQDENYEALSSFVESRLGKDIVDAKIFDPYELAYLLSVTPGGKVREAHGYSVLVREDPRYPARNSPSHSPTQSVNFRVIPPGVEPPDGWTRFDASHPRYEDARDAIEGI